MPLVSVKLAEGVFTEKPKHDLAARITDVMVAFEGSEAFGELVWVLIENSTTTAGTSAASRSSGHPP
jgi:4-oxalocrotonate tautomerase